MGGFPYYVILITISAIAVMLVIVRKSEERTVAPVLLLFYVIAVLGITLFVRDFDLEKELISGAAYLHFQWNQINKEAMEESK